MTVAPLPRPRIDRLGTTTTRVRQPPTRRQMVARRTTVRWTKRLLPVVALLLLTSVAMWPEISRQFDKARFGFHRGGLSGQWEAGKLLNVRYHGLDARNRPYTVTAEQAVQAGPERINLVAPKGDAFSENGSWTYGQSQRGVYMQHTGLLDLSGDVTIFRDNGISMRTESADVDMKTGAASSSEPTHSEGPFGTLDSLGFALVDKGAVIQFDGKSRLLLNGSHQ
jgi:lipopolysaccharide export system protein LptC